MKKYSVVIVSPQVPKPEPTNAGERLIRELYFALEAQGHNPIFLAPFPRNGLADFYDVSAQFVQVEKTSLEKTVQKVLSPISTWTPNLIFFISMVRDKEARAILKRAKIIDLQWTSSVLLAPLIRLLNPSAQITGTFHDISEQRLKRRARTADSPLKSLAWRAQAAVSGRADGLVVRSLNQAIVLSEKDRLLVKCSPIQSDKVVSVIPPVYLDMGSLPARHPDLNQILFVGTMYRWENHQAVEWFIKDILPLVWAKKPDVKFTVVGQSPSSDLIKQAADPRITFTGFVEDLELYYAEASMVVAPLQLGSGVKFKTLDAILRSIPVVATSAGIEGIAKVEWASALAHSAESFAQRVLDVLDNYDAFTQKAHRAQQEALEVYSQEAYRKLIGEVYEQK